MPHLGSHVWVPAGVSPHCQMKPMAGLGQHSQNVCTPSLPCLATDMPVAMPTPTNMPCGPLSRMRPLGKPTPGEALRASRHRATMRPHIRCPSKHASASGIGGRCTHTWSHSTKSVCKRAVCAGALLGLLRGLWQSCVQYCIRPYIRVHHEPPTAGPGCLKGPHVSSA